MGDTAEKDRSRECKSHGLAMTKRGRKRDGRQRDREREFEGREKKIEEGGEAEGIGRREIREKRPRE